MGEREQRLTFGEVAEDYDDVRAGYSPELAAAVIDYAGDPAELVEVGAGTGKATAAFAGYARPITCLEPDAAMAAVLRSRFAGRPLVRVLPCGFEEWTPPPGGVPLVYGGQMWHWVDPAVRWAKASEVLSPGGTLALFGHHYTFVDPALEASLDAAYAATAPELLDVPDSRPVPPTDHWTYREMVDCGRFVDVSALLMESVVDYPGHRYRRLLQTFSPHRMLPPARRDALLDAVDAAVERHGGTVQVALKTTLVLGRRPD